MPRRWLSADPDRWRTRAVRLLLVYTALSLTLLSTRYATREVRPELLDARRQEAELTQERDTRDLRVQSLLSETQVQNWALRNGMIRFAEAPKTSRDLGSQTLPALPQPPAERLKVKIQWN